MTRFLRSLTSTCRAGDRRASRHGAPSQQIQIVVNRYIGVTGGYLGDFSYRTHTDF